jgi:hypothetical protein
MARMTEITRIDRLMDRLRAQLERKPAGDGGRSVQASGAGASSPATGGQAASLSAVMKDLVASGVTEERVLVTVLVERLLRDSLGAAVSSGPQFHQMLDVVVDALADDDEAWSLCKACIADTLEGA